ncbi:amino acid ABC transporter permease [Verminephrobacter aporrectodeae subsp. tuberculatae]|uniref:Amino acid ABC transporter permease n=1 Tax=Verminephrobacter aporrectodeae subsp. tuberculatae TaxID=1110392 RepID=A0ABT3KPH6_9BURK|nr:amino acid ABC transporter permease [Verminephrobacter aporrectodeae]MCW5220841.1 amino acid ABC transporter permease [Verminephrobacter aporrectodeae subsp. tuberculatae]MCW5290136.1 amino acid ABC transporter permease [Verminephrobacter aporrectodeae subsp. tuberculatae]MCW5320214.1 amino acid ABC transporter permease [Verminephrobacter aporrectodeae subsp. tuberculatae]MCW8197564.1 amino acid ABC transporter permease [Verminephrobacter aporrectodeae subsp. tuberculatae]
MFYYTFYWSVVWNKLPVLLEGAVLTIEATALSMLIGTCLALPLALMRRRSAGPAHYFATAWVEVSRNTPALFQIYMAYFGLGAIGIDIPSFAALLVAISFNNAGYLAEIFRGGLASVAPTQMAAARSLGLSTPRTYLHVIFPQVFVLVFFPFINQLNWALLNTSLGSIIGVRELTGATQAAQSESFRTFEFFIVAAAIYYMISKLITLGARLSAWRLLSQG